MRQTPSRLLAMVLAALLCAAFPVQATRPTRQVQLQRFRLKNGLEVLLRPVSGATQTALVVLFSIGGLHDPPGRSGLAHLLEHVYVTAAAGSTPARTADELMRAGGGNAQTGDDYTVIADVFPGSELGSRLQDAADRMSDLRIRQSDLDREKPRLQAEVENMFGRIPALGAFNRAREGVCPSPAGGRKGGLPGQVAKLSAAEVESRWRWYYKQANARLVVAGNFDASAARKQIEARFGAVPAGEPAPPVRPRPKARTGTFREVPLSGGNGAAEVSLTFAAPRPGSAGYPAFLVLAARLLGRAADLRAGEPPRFPPPVYYAMLDDPAVLSVNARVSKGETPEGTVQRLDRLVSRALAANLTPDDRMGPERHFGPFLGLVEIPDTMWAQNPYGLAFSLGRRAQLGLDSAALRRALERLRTEDLRRCARTVFAADKRAAIAVVSR